MPDKRWSLRGIPAVLLEGRYLRVTVLPELGGKIYSIVSKADDTELLWHNPRLDPRRPSTRALSLEQATGIGEEITMLPGQEIRADVHLEVAPA